MPNKFTSKFAVFKDPIELLVFYDKKFLDGIVKLYPWQIEILKEFAKDKPMDHIIRMAVIAANGSGKSQYVLAPCALWLAVAFEDALAYITSSSAVQLDTQTERFIDSLADKMDVISLDIMGTTVWDNVKRKKYFKPNKSYIDLFATDEPKRAEGKHPLEGDSEFGIFIDEGKSINEDIYGAIDRCTGATRRLDISSAGGCHGHFYEVNTKPELGWWTRKILYSDCPHISKDEYEQQIKKHGIHDPLVRSMFFSEFTDIEDATVIKRETLERCVVSGNNPVPCLKFNFEPSGIRAGLDLSAGGDETVMSIWDNNIMLDQETARFKDVGRAVQEIIHWQQKWKIANENIWVEFDGFNRGIVAMLDDKGHSYNKVLSGGRAVDDKRYANRITELWFKFKRYVEEGLVSIKPDLQLKSQLANRYYRRHTGTDKIILERKEEARKKGHPSPDRADALIFAWAAAPNIESFQAEYVGIKKKSSNKYGKQVPLGMVEQVVDEWTYGEAPFFEKQNQQLKKPVNNNLDAVESTSKEESFLSTDEEHSSLTFYEQSF